MEKGFFKVFNPENSAQKMKIPISFIDFKNGKLPRKVSLRDRFGNMWPIGVNKTGRSFYFQYGWEKFVKDNTLEFGDFLVFDFDGHRTFDIKLLGINGCEKKGAGSEKKEEEMNVEHRRSVKPKGKNQANDSSNSSSDDDDSAEEYIVEEEKEDEEAYEEEEEKEVEEGIEKALSSKRKSVEEEDNEEEDEEENESTGTSKKKVLRSKAKYERATAPKVRNQHDQYGTDIFKSGRSTQPKNPYFVAKLRPKRSNQLYVPCDVVRDYKLEIPSKMTIRDSSGREFETKLKNWKDGRKWLIGGWRSLCKWNLVDKDDNCICEFIRGEHNECLYLQVQVLREESSSHTNKK